MSLPCNAWLAIVPILQKRKLSFGKSRDFQRPQALEGGRLEFERRVSAPRFWALVAPLCCPLGCTLDKRLAGDCCVHCRLTSCWHFPVASSSQPQSTTTSPVTSLRATRGRGSDPGLGLPWLLVAQPTHRGHSQNWQMRNSVSLPGVSFTQQPRPDSRETRRRKEQRAVTRGRCSSNQGSVANFLKTEW